MKDIATVDLDPLNVGGHTFARKQANARCVIRIPYIWERPPRHRQLEIEQTRQIKNQHVFFSDRTVMHHRATWQCDIDRASHFAVNTHNEILHLIAPTPPISHHVQFTGAWVTLWMRRKSLRQSVGKIRNTNGFKFVIHFDRRRTTFDKRPSCTCMTDHICIRRKLCMIGRPI